MSNSAPELVAPRNVRWNDNVWRYIGGAGSNDLPVPSFSFCTPPPPSTQRPIHLIRIRSTIFPSLSRAPLGSPYSHLIASKPEVRFAKVLVNVRAAPKSL